MVAKSIFKSIFKGASRGFAGGEGTGPDQTNLLAYWPNSPIVDGKLIARAPVASHSIQQVKGSGFAGIGSGTITGLLTTDDLTSSGPDTPTCTVDGTVIFGADCWDIFWHRDGVLIDYFPGINVGGTFEIGAKGVGNVLYLTDTTITERLDGTGTNYANERGFTVADGTQYLDETGETAIGAGWRIPALLDGSGCAAWLYTQGEMMSLGTSDDKIRLVWQTDTHATVLATTQNDLSAAVADLNTWRPNALIITGDIGGNALENTRAAWSVLNTAHRPKIVAIGNHDEEELTFGAGNPNTEAIEGVAFWNQPAPFNHAHVITSGDNSFSALCLALDSNIYDDDPSEVLISPYHSPGDRCGSSVEYPDNSWWRMFNTDTLTWVGSQLEAHPECAAILVVLHYPPTGVTMTNYSALVDIIQADGRPCIGFAGHVHENATTYSAQSTDTILSIPFYKAPAALDSHCWTRVTLSMSGGNISVDEMLVRNFTNPAAWTINAPFALEE